MKKVCTWCADPNAEEVDENTCDLHLAEAEGITVSQLEDRDRIQRDEEWDATH